MSDYLTQLAATILNQSPVIRARVPALFEPVRRFGVSPQINSDAIQKISGEISTPPMSLAKQDGQKSSESSASLNGTLNANESLKPRSSRAKINDSARSRELLTGESVRLEHSVAELKPGEVQKIRDAMTAANSETVLVVTPSQSYTVEKRSGREQPNPLMVEQMLLRTLSEREVDPDMTSVPLIHKAGPRSNQVIRPSSSVILAQPKVTRLIETPQHPSRESNPTTETAHTIHVTIGRIEVRAQLPAPPPPVERVVPPTPKMSLDDYLRAQHRGDK